MYRLTHNILGDVNRVDLLLFFVLGFTNYDSLNQLASILEINQLYVILNVSLCQGIIMVIIARVNSDRFLFCTKTA